MKITEKTSVLKYLRPYIKETILAPLFKLLEACFELLVPLVVANMVDNGVAKSDLSNVLKSGAILVALGIIGIVCSVTAQFFAAKAATLFGKELRHDLFKHIGKLSYSQLDTLGTSTLITRLSSDVNEASSGVNMILRLFLRAPIVVFGAAIMAFIIDKRIAGIFFLMIAILILAVFGVMFRQMPFQKQIRKKTDTLLLRVRENISGVRVIRAFNRQKAESKDFDNAALSLRSTQFKAGSINAALNPATYLILNLCLILLLQKSGNAVFNGRITNGEVIALVNYISQILVELIKMTNFIQTMAKSIACAGRIGSILDITPDDCAIEGREQQDNDSENDCIVFENVSFKYGNAKEYSLSDISFSVKKGKIVGIIGATGSGKTTLVNLIPRFYKASEGVVKYNGENINNVDVRKLRDKIGIVPQKALLFEGTVAENLQWGNESASQSEMWEALLMAQAKDFVSGIESGLFGKVSKNGGNLSGGQRQRLTIARALVRNPEILILDDSASALDFMTEKNLRNAIRELGEKSGMTTFIVSQRIGSIQHADFIIVLADGNMVGKGTHEELIRECAEYRETAEMG